MLDMRHLNGLDDEEKIIPCEVSILEYSLDKGIERVAHKFINPGMNAFISCCLKSNF